jgi:hypothetical protein
MRTSFWGVAPWLSRIPLLVSCLFFISLGARWLRDPRAAAAGNGVTIDAAASETLTNMRGTGAVFMGLAVIVAACLVSTPRVLTGLRFLTTLVASTFVVRCAILALDGATPLLLRIMGTEVVLLLVTASALALETVRRRREERAATGPLRQTDAPLGA